MVTTVIPSELSEGEEEIIQIPINNSERNPSKNQLKIQTEASTDSKTQNLVPFPSVPEILDPIPSEPIEEAHDELQLGHGH